MNKIICPVCDESVDYGKCPYCSNVMLALESLKTTFIEEILNEEDDARDKEFENRIAKEIDEERGVK